MKGDLKRRKRRVFFTRGHKCFATKTETYQRKASSPQPSTSAGLVSTVGMTKQEPVSIQEPASTGMRGNDTIGKKPRETSGPLLRPRRLKSERKVSSGNRIINNFKMVGMMNSVYESHAKSKKKCDSLKLEILNEIKLGLAWKYQFQCKSCKFKSSMYKLYEEQVVERKTKPGKLAAAINLSLGVVLMDTPIANTKFRFILTALDIPPPSMSNMQKISNEASEKIKELNKKDMTEKRRLLEAHNKQTNATNPKEITFSLDGRYGGRGFSSSAKPGQKSTQAYTVAIENVTEQQYIIGLAIENKLCWTGAWLRNRGFKAKCPGGHADCTANLEYVAPHSERNMSYRIAADLSLEDYWARSVTTDGDTKAWLGVQDFYQTLKSTWTVDRQADPNHLAVRQISKCRQANFSMGMFPELSGLRDARRRALTAFSKDVKSRCSLITEELFKKGDGDMKKVIHTLPDVVAATIECYAGNCSNCTGNSLVCSGLSEGNWWIKSSFLGPHNITHLKMNEDDKKLLRAILEMRLSEDAILKVSSRTSTQKCEAFNSSTAATLRKGVNYPTNFEGRVSAAAHRINNSLGQSLKDKIHYVTGRQLSRKTIIALDKITKDYEYHKTYTATPAFKKKRVLRRAKVEAEYYRYREGQSDDEEDYVKGQLDDHTYAYTPPAKRTKSSLVGTS